MSVSMQTPTLSVGNHIYLYRLFKESVGCGKQMLLPAFEEVLESANLAATDLGFESTRALLEALDDCVTLTVFKGGRVYATLTPQPTWDEALAAEDAGKQKDAGKGGKSWKKKRTDKSLKAVRPKRVKRPEPKTAPKPEPQPEATAELEPMLDSETGAEAESTPEAEAQTEVVSAPEATPENAQKTLPEAMPEPGSAPDAQSEPDSEPQSEKTAAEAPAGASKQEPEHAGYADAAEAPAISLTVVYDPEHANDGVRTLESTPHHPEAHGSQTADDAESQTKASDATAAESSTESPAAEPAATIESVSDRATAEQTATDAADDQSRPQNDRTENAPMPASASAIPEGYPVDFATEVFCSGDLLNKLAALLPYGADALGIVGEYYWIARENGSIAAQRNRATFALRYTHRGARHEAQIRIRRNAQGGMGASWTIDSIDLVEK